jgi:hypothetical protein
MPLSPFGKGQKLDYIYGESVHPHKAKPDHSSTTKGTA